jgi:uncharacterized protein YjiS (DUF1127 family)
MKYATPEAFEFGTAELPLADTTSNLASRFYKTVKTWRQRSITRAQLAGISSHNLQDIGISRIDSHIESNKPFWEE